MNDVSLFLDVEAQTVEVLGDDSPTVSVIWDRAIQEAVTVRAGLGQPTGPTIGSRAYGVLHTAIYDAWAQYDPVAVGSVVGDDYQVPLSEINDANKVEAMSYAAFNVAQWLFPEQEAIYLAALEAIETEFGVIVDPANDTLDPSTAAGIGNLVAEAIIEFRTDDGSNQEGGFADTTGYTPANVGPTDSDDTGLVINDIERWTPEFNEGLGITQPPLTPQWGLVTPFALEIGEATRPPAPEPFLLESSPVGIEAFDFAAGTVDLGDGNGPISVADNAETLVGTVINPGFIEQTVDVIEASANLTSEEKLIAEFWEDGGGTSFPPGTWLTFGQFASAEADNTIDDDAVFFLALGNAVQDAGIATWEAKYFPDYDYTRPIRAIRELGRLGLVGEENPGTGLFEVEATVRFEGTQTIPAIEFETYQEPQGDPSPPFPEYTSGHSAFSRAGAEVIKAFTGSDEFNQGVTFPAGSARFEGTQAAIDAGLDPNDPGIITTPTPEEGDITLFWETYTDAADEAGLSRIFGGIHFEDGDQNGRELGRITGLAAVEQAEFLASGGELAVSNVVSGSADSDDLLGGVTAGFSGVNDVIFTGAGDDTVDNGFAPSTVLGNNNRINTGSGNDTIIVADGDRAFGGSGDDEFEATDAEGYRLSGGDGDDLFFLGADGRALGGDGDDRFFVQEGGENLLAGGEGADQFWIFGGDQPDAANTIADFEAGTDVIGLIASGLSFADLTFDGGTISTDSGDLAILLGVEASTLTESNFMFT